MQRSTERILTTHTGSLPRPPDLAATLETMDAGTAPDPEAFNARVRQTVAEVVRRQIEAGVDVISDGEQGKVGYSTYVRYRLTGFEGQSAVPIRSDWADFPEAAARYGRSSGVRPACNGPIDWKDRGAVRQDIANLKAALAGVQPTEVFMTAASLGRLEISVTPPGHHIEPATVERYAAIGVDRLVLRPGPALAGVVLEQFVIRTARELDIQAH
jgi:5-methyltetrahydropteroyltriglutamate--homocysteine methyltransferase